MSLRLTSFLAPATALLAMSALAGCPGNDHDAHFAQATEQQLDRAFTSASGADLQSAIFIGILFSGAPSDATACPSIVTAGQDTTLTGGCDDADGAHWEGTITVHNLPGFFTENPAYDETQPGSVSFNQLHVTDAETDVTIDGVSEIAPDPLQIAGDLTIDAEGLETTSALTLECTADGPCTASGDSEIQVGELGGAGVEGTWSMGDPATGSITLHGADDLVFDLAATDANGCVPYSVGDKSGLVCGDSTDSAGARKLTTGSHAAWTDVITRARR